MYRGHIPDFLDKALETIKLPIKHIWVLAVFSGLVVFLPEEYSSKLGLADFAKDYRPYIGATFIFSSCLVVAELLKRGAYFFKARKEKAKDFEFLISALPKLDFHEKAVLREFYIQERNTLQLPFDNAVIAGMRKSRLLVLAEDMGERSLAGTLMPMQVNPQIEAYLSSNVIGLPDTAEPTEDEVYWVQTNRPSFMAEIERHNEIFHRH